MAETITIIKHVREEGPGILGECFREGGRETGTIDLYAGDVFPEDLDTVAAVVMLGGPMNVYEEKKYPFLAPEDAFIKRVLAKDIPFLGICLGAQLLAKACGAGVTKAFRKEVGWNEVAFTADGKRDPLFRGLPAILPVFQWHEDTFSIPEGAFLLATGDDCRNQAFRVGNAAYGLQFHVEVTPEMATAWLETIGEEPQEDRVGKTTAPDDGYLHSFRRRGQTLAANFLRIVESNARVRRVVHRFVDSPARQSTELWWSVEKKTLVG